MPRKWTAVEPFGVIETGVILCIYDFQTAGRGAKEKKKMGFVRIFCVNMGCFYNPTHIRKN